MSGGRPWNGSIPNIPFDPVRGEYPDLVLHVASNILNHREYPNVFPARLIIGGGQVRTENSNNPHGFSTLNPAQYRIDQLER